MGSAVKGKGKAAKTVIDMMLRLQREEDGVTDGSGASNAGSSAVFQSHQAAGDDIDDSFYKMRVPVVTSQSPSLTENIVYLRILGIDLFEPKCMLPLGAHGVDGGKIQKDIWCSDECKSGERRQRRPLQPR
mgnify:CR=1 FL=1